MNETLIKNKMRVEKYGEVYTGYRQVNDMINLMKKEIECISSTVLEPACGNGNFLKEVLKRKLKSVLEIDDLYLLKKNMLVALTSIYGIDIQLDNIKECRLMLLNTIKDYYKFLVKDELDEKTILAAEYILNRNIICGNTLTGLNNNCKSILINKWSIDNYGIITREIFEYNELVNGYDAGNHRKYTFTWFDKDELLNFVEREAS